MTAGPDDAWIRQVGSNLTDPIDGFLREKRFCLMDRDAKFTTAFRTLSAEAEIERFMRSITSECLDRMIFFGADSLRRALSEYVAHDHTERNHQGLGGMLRHDHRDAA